MMQKISQMPHSHKVLLKKEEIANILMKCCSQRKIEGGRRRIYEHYMHAYKWQWNDSKEGLGKINTSRGENFCRKK